jgi:DNA-binding NtrC family response regulator
MKLLVVGDEMNSMVPFLEKSRFACISAPGVRRAIPVVTSKRPEVVVTEVSLPEGIGFDIIKHVQQVSPKTPVILASADIEYDDEDKIVSMEEASLLAGAAAHLRKPVTPEALEQTIKAAINVPVEPSPSRGAANPAPARLNEKIA